MLLIAVVTLYVVVIVLGLALLRSAALADRDAERRRVAQRRQVAPRQVARRRDRATRVLLITVTATAGASAGPGPPVARSAAPTCVAPAAATLCLVNAERRVHGAPALSANAALTLAARRHAADMVRRRYFSHTSPGGARVADRLRRVGYVGICAWSAGEALAWGYGDQASPGSRVAAWMASPRHRRVLLDPAYRDAGVGVARGVPSGAADGFSYAAELGRLRC